MKLSDFNFDLPKELIAQYPLAERTESRLLSLDGDTGQIADRVFASLPELLSPGDLLVFNNTRVIPARLFGNKETGGKLEVLVERIVSERQFLAQVRSSKSPKTGAVLQLGTDKGKGFTVKMSGRQENLFRLELLPGQNPGSTLIGLLEQFGHVPLPPYVERKDTDQDLERYQTVYASEDGAVAAPTAGLHFDNALIESIQQQGVGIAWVTLHVGAGTFQPVRVEDIREHKMHSEYVDVSEDTVARIRQTKRRGGRVVAVGTTALRSLESASSSGTIQEYHDDTDIFIYPGYRFKTVDALVTNFHLPESTLIMLVSAFAGIDNVRQAYAHAIREKYRFFSYGDAMFITLKKDPSQ